MELHSFLEWVDANEFDVIVWDMDCTMSAGHCGPGLPLDKHAEYIAQTSEDFITAVNGLAGMDPEGKELHRERRVRCAVATGSDPYEYDLPGQSRDTHILGPDLATSVIRAKCPKALNLFDIMIGYDCRLHQNEGDASLNNEGKRHHMRTIRKFFDVPFERMVLIDDSRSSLENEDGWVGVKVDGKAGFKFEHCVGPWRAEQEHAKLPLVRRRLST
jgi:hypothetical protein